MLKFTEELFAYNSSLQVTASTGSVKMSPGLLVQILISFLFIPCISAASWNYKDTNWPGLCQEANQSPINLPTKGLATATFPSISFSSYDAIPAKMSLTNNGHSAKLSVEPKIGDEAVISNGGLPHRYQCAQLHFHWGSEDTKGSEHLVDGTGFPMEMHFVHFKAIHPNIKDALKEGTFDSLAVIGVFFKVSESRNPGIDLLLPYLQKVKTTNTEVTVSPFPLESLLWGADMSSFYRYNGSLTTPGCFPIVQWTVVKQPISISQDQLNMFRQLLTKEDEPLVDNFRPVQELGARTILDVKTEDPQRVNTGSQKRCPSLAERSEVMGLLIIASIVKAFL